jgi:hypothetical protein
MKTLKLHWTLFLALLLSVTAFGQLQRLAILPQKGITITNTAAARLKSIGIDYYREAPNLVNTKNQAAYNQVYADAEVIVIINGIRSSKSFQSLVQPANPLLLLQPASLSEVGLSINPKNPESKAIWSIGIEFMSAATIGNNKDDGDVLQSQAIFKNWGYALSQDGFWDRAKGLDILSQNNRITYQPATANLKQQCDQLLNSMDFTIFSNKAFRTLVLNKSFVLDNSLNLTPESAQTRCSSVSIMSSPSHRPRQSTSIGLSMKRCLPTNLRASTRRWPITQSLTFTGIAKS